MNKQITLKDLETRRQHVLNEIHTQERDMGTTYRHIFQPIKATASYAEDVSHTINSLISIYQGIRMGYKIVRLFGRHKKKRN